MKKTRKFSKLEIFELFTIIMLCIALFSTELSQNTKNVVSDKNESSIMNLLNEKKEYVAEYIDNETVTFESLTDKNDSNNIFLKAYPVGSIYISYNNTNPGTVFGGTWVSFGEGRTLVGVSNGESSGKTGGSSSVSYTPSGTVGDHTLTIAEIPSHTHTYTSGRWAWSEESGGNNIINSQSETSLRFTRTSGATGGGEAHNHPFTGTASTIDVQDPYITVYMWRRTA